MKARMPMSLALLAAVGSAWGGMPAVEPPSPIDVVAVYYPHWHRYPKGDEWFGADRWSEGEWQFVKTAKPRFSGHRLPIKPLPGYLSGSDPRDVETEIELAANAGIDVFLYDYYYYGGKVTQEEAIEQGFLKAPNRGKMKFALMWCYHERVDRFRTPIDGEPRTLMALDHTPDELIGLIDLSIGRYFGRPEYWRKDGKLFFSIFGGPYLFKTVGKDALRAALTEARRRVAAAGLGEIHFNIQGLKPEQVRVAKEIGFDSTTHYNVVPRSSEPTCDYGAIIEESRRRWAAHADGPLPYIPVVTTGWDSSPRCQEKEPFPWKRRSYPYGAIFTNATPDRIETLLRDAKAFVEKDPHHFNVVYINSWNEYTEGCWLLPTVRENDLRLRAVRRVFGGKPAKIVGCAMKHWWNKNAKNGTSFSVDAPTYENLKYGPHYRQGMDVWLPETKAAAPTPVLINIHGGAWVDGDRIGGTEMMLAACRDAGVALVTISYRMVADANDAGIRPPVKACLDDAVAAVRFVQAHAAEWNVDPARVGLTGGSAGACSSLYAALQGDNALGIRAVLAASPQTSLDPKEMKEWIPNSRYGSHAFGYANFAVWLDHRADCLAEINRYSPAALLRACTAKRAPVFLYSCAALPPKGELPKDPTHAAMFCVKFGEICADRGIVCRKGALNDLLTELCK